MFVKLRDDVRYLNIIVFLLKYRTSVRNKQKRVPIRTKIMRTVYKSPVLIINLTLFTNHQICLRINISVLLHYKLVFIIK